MKRLAVVVVVGLALLAPPPASATTFIVNSTADLHDANTSDGSCAAVGGACTLRAAVEQANALGGAQTISLPTGSYTLTIDEWPYHMTVNTLGADITVSGAGILSTAINSNDVGEILSIESGASVTMRSVLIDGGQNGGTDGCFSNAGTLRLTGVLVKDCTNSGAGGAISNSGTLVVQRSTLDGNRSNTSSSGGGAIANGGVLVMANVTLSNNTASFGGAVTHAGTSMDLSEVRLQGNHATSWGGAVYLDHANATLNRVTFSDNSSVNGAGAMVVSSGSAELTNVTFSGNTSTGPGGAISLGSASLTLRNVTITGSSDNGTAAALRWDSGSVTTSVANTLIAGNGAVNCNFPLTSLGHNLEDHATCGLGAPGDLVGVSPLLGPLADNQGLTKTVALIAGSPGIDAGDDALAAATDQRGVPRPQDGDGIGGAVSDIGAFERVDLIFLSGFEKGGTFDWSSSAP